MSEKIAEGGAKNAKTGASVLFCLLCAASVLLFPSLVSKSLLRSLERFYRCLLPALFPMMILSRRLLCALPQKSGPRFFRFCRTFSLTPDSFFLFLTGLLCGYPLPAALCAELFSQKRLGARDAERCAALFDNASPGFLIAFVGNGLLGSVKYGVFLYIAQTLAVLCAMRIFSRSEKSPPDGRAFAEKSEKGREPSSLTEDIRRAAHTLLEIAAFTAAFSLAADFAAVFLSAIPLPKSTVGFAAGLLEITDGCTLLSDCPKEVLFLLLPFLSGLGGASVLCQVRAALPRGLSIRPYLAARALIACLMTACFFVMTRISP